MAQWQSTGLPCTRCWDQCHIVNIPELFLRGTCPIWCIKVSLCLLTSLPLDHNATTAGHFLIVPLSDWNRSSLVHEAEVQCVWREWREMTSYCRSGLVYLGVRSVSGRYRQQGQVLTVILHYTGSWRPDHVSKVGVGRGGRRMARQDEHLLYKPGDPSSSPEPTEEEGESQLYDVVL